ncbi:hypothetical protein KGM_209216B, partial [Danaus plexippus plexippus]
GVQSGLKKVGLAMLSLSISIDDKNKVSNGASCYPSLMGNAIPFHGTHGACFDHST